MTRIEEEYDHAISFIRDLEEQIDLMKKQIEKFTLDHADSSEDFLNEDYVDPTNMMDFLEEIGFDPFDLPSSVGERMEIRDRVASAIPDLSQALEECQDNSKHLEEHYNRAWELGYDPITKDFYCRACDRAKRRD